MTPRHLDYAPGRWRYHRLTWVTEERVGFRGREKEKENELRFRYVEFEVPVGHPGGDVQWAGGNTGLELGGEVGAGDIDFGVVSI